MFAAAPVNAVDGDTASSRTRWRRNDHTTSRGVFFRQNWAVESKQPFNWLEHPLRYLAVSTRRAGISSY